MPINKMDMHYSMTNPATVYDEEALTALELAGRTAGKLNEMVEEINRIPEIVSKDVDKYIEKGEFASAINAYAGGLIERLDKIEADANGVTGDIVEAQTAHEARVSDELEDIRAEQTAHESSVTTSINNINNRVNNLINGNPSTDTEVIDIRNRIDGTVASSAGVAVRDNDLKTSGIYTAGVYVSNNGSITIRSISGGKIEATFSHIPVFRMWDKDPPSFSWSDFKSQLGDACVLDDVDTNKATITIPSYNMLVYNAVSNSLAMRSLHRCIAGDVPLIKNAYGSYCGGHLDYAVQRGSTGLYKYPGAGFCYISSNGRVDIHRKDPSSAAWYDIEIFGQLNVATGGFSEYVNWGDISTALQTQTTASIEYDDEASPRYAKISLDTRDRRALVYNTIDKQLYYRSATQISNGDYLLCGFSYGQATDGILYRKWIEHRLSDAEADLTNVITTPSETATRAKLRQHAGRAVYTANYSSFMFFTDPHTVQGENDSWLNTFKSYMGQLGSIYNSAMTDFVICGGDWIGNGDTQDEAAYKMSFIRKNLDKIMGDRVYHVLGNHDTNYQGKLTPSSENWTGTLPQSVNNRLWYDGNSYYTFTDARCRYYVFDSGLDSVLSITEYKAEQIKWFISELEKHDDKNIVIVMHIAVINAEGSYHDFSHEIMMAARQYNNRIAHTYGGVTGNYSGKTGKIRYALGGHIHMDMVTNIHDIPVIITTQTKENGVATCDIIFADYDANKIHLTRIGSGEDRVVDMA